MSELIVFAFRTPSGAEEILDTLNTLQKQKHTRPGDVVVVRDVDGRVRTKQATSPVGAGVLNGAFWELLIGLFFLTPLLGLAEVAATRPLACKLADIGIDYAFIRAIGAGLA